MYTNIYEWVAFVIAALLLWTALRLILKSGRLALVLTALTLIPLYASVERNSQFITFDETYFMYEGFQLDTALLGRWFQSKLRTTLFLFGPAFYVYQQFAGPLPEETARIILKNLHWLSGFVAMIGVYWLLVRSFVKTHERPLLAALFFPGMLLLPINNLGLKIFNADSLALLLGFMATLLIITAMQRQSRREALYALLIAYLASQEKLIASPIVALALTVYAVIHAQTSTQEQPMLTRLIRYTMNGFGFLILLGIVQAVVVALVRRSDFVAAIWLLLITPDPAVSWAWPVLYVLGLSVEGRFLIDRSSMLMLVAITLSSVVAGGWILMRLQQFNWRRYVPLAALGAHGLIVILIPLILVAGIVGFFNVNALIAPTIPIEATMYDPGTAYNEFTVHFGVGTFLEHLVSFTGLWSAMFVSTIPTLFWLAIIAAGVLLLADKQCRFVLDLPDGLILVGLLFPLGYGVMQMPARLTYINIGVFLLVLGAILRCLPYLAELKPLVKYGAVITASVLLLIEVLPFAPVYAIFHPFWLTYDSVRNSTQLKGKMDPIWMGWGEELMLAGQHIEADCRAENKSCDDVTLYMPYPARWLNEETPIRTQIFVFSDVEPDDLTYTEQDYYVLNRNTLAHGFVEFPQGVEPAFTIDARGYILAWVFRGDQLDEAGFQFTWNSLTQT